jgi:hypothetical protein
MKKLFLLPLIILGLTANATDRYISTSGNDGNSGASSSPWRTLAYAASHSSSGDLIHVAAGSYVESSRVDLPEGVSITGAGSSTTIIQSTYSIASSGQSQDDAIILLNSSSVSGTGQTISYLTFDGRNLASTRAICINQRSNVIISNCTIQNFLLSAITINHGGGSFTSGMEIHDCTINNCATEDPSVDTHSNSGSITLFGINGMLIYNNNFTQTARATGQNGDVIRGIDSYSYGLKGLKIYNNTFTKNNTEGTQWNFTIELWQLSDECEVYNNAFNGTGGMDFCGIQKGNRSYGLSIHDNTITASANFAQPSGGPSEQGINFEDANGGSLNNTGVQQYIYVYNNYFKYIPNPIRFDFTIFDSDTKGLMDHIYIYNNVFDQFGYTNNVGVSMGIYMNDHAQSPITYDNIHIYNNTFVGNSYSQQGIQWNCYGTAHTNFSIDNNIFSGLRSNPISFSALSGSPSVTIISVQNNDYFNNSTNTPSYSGVTMNSKTEQNSITTNPLFISSTNYQLQPSSSCINAGINVGLPFSGTAPDIGRYEYSSSGSIANAGPDQIITIPTSIDTLIGSGTSSNGSISSYSWTKISGPSLGSLSNASSATTTVTGLVQGIYQFELKVTDNNGAVGRDTMQLTVNSATIVNIPPVANAGLDQTITLPASTVTLSGSGIDSGGIITIFFWTKISGPSFGSITNASSATTTVTGLVQGVYKFELKVTDNNGAVGRDTMQVTVNAAVIVNIPPVANAGLDQTITLPASTVTLTGSGSDADGTVTGYLWTKISGPSTFNIVNTASPVTDVSGMVQGVYQFELKVTDNNGAVGRDTMQVTVNAAVIVNIPPVANAGLDQTIALPASTVTLTGSGSDADGTVTGYLWTKISGPSTFNIVNVASSITDVTGLVQGIYQFELKVTDNNGAVGRDTMQVTVNAAPKTDKGPVAKAGSHKTLTLPSDTTTLNGSATSTNGSISSYTWTKISGPSTGTITTANSPVTSIIGLVQGIYQFELKVVDSIGAAGRDTTQVTVNNAANLPPVANAGLDQTITLPTNSTSITGSGTDPDGTITGYSWKQISGPSGNTLVSPNNAVTFLNNLVGGTYKFELAVTDNLGAIGRDTVEVVVAVPRLNLDVQSNNISIYPNPVMDITTLEINTTKANQKLLVVISNMQGSIVYKNEFASGQTNIRDKINLSNLSKGTYAVTVYFSIWEKQTLKLLKL